MKDEEIITRLAMQYDFIYSPNVAASENFDEDKYANTTDVTVWKAEFSRLLPNLSTQLRP